MQPTGRYQMYPRLGDDPERIAAFDGTEIIPDFSDPATLGCLLALVREAHNDPSIFADPHLSKWCVATPTPGGDMGKIWAGIHTEDTEAEALVAALESAQ